MLCDVKNPFLNLKLQSNLSITGNSTNLLATRGIPLNDETTLHRQIRPPHSLYVQFWVTSALTCFLRDCTLGLNCQGCFGHKTGSYQLHTSPQSRDSNWLISATWSDAGLRSRDIISPSGSGRSITQTFFFFGWPHSITQNLTFPYLMCPYYLL